MSPLHGDLTRRRFVTAALTLAGLAACGDDGDETGTGTTAGDTTGNGREAGWTFTDAVGEVAALPAPPERIVAYVGSAAALWDWGVRPIGVIGSQRNADGTRAEAADLASYPPLGLEIVERPC